MSETKKQPIDEVQAIDWESVANIGAVVKSKRKWDKTHKDMLNLEVGIESFIEITTGYGPALLADAVHDGESFKLLIGSTILQSQLREVEDQLPMRGKIVKVGRYYQFG